MTNQGVNIQLPSEGQFSVAVDTRRDPRSERSEWSNQTPIAPRRAKEERGDTLLVTERRRSRRISRRDPRSERSEWSNQTPIAPRRAEEERGDMLSSPNELGERGNQTRIARRCPGRASEQLQVVSE
jgi:hypothetical protein